MPQPVLFRDKGCPPCKYRRFHMVTVTSPQVLNRILQVMPGGRATRCNDFAVSITCNCTKTSKFTLFVFVFEMAYPLRVVPNVNFFLFLTVCIAGIDTGVLMVHQDLYFPFKFPPFLVVSLLLNKSTGNHISILSINLYFRSNVYEFK